MYIASGNDVEQGGGRGRLVCIDPTKRGDVSAELAVNAESQILPHRRKQTVDTKVGEKAIANPNSALVWEFIKCGNEFEDEMHVTLGSVAIAKGLVFASDFEGLMHCVDAKTGKRHWRYDTFSSIKASPLIVDDKVYMADEEGDVAIFGLSADPKVAGQMLNGQIQPMAEILMGINIDSSPVFANGVLYIARRNRLFAIDGDKEHVDPQLTSGYWPQWRGPNRDNVSRSTAEAAGVKSLVNFEPKDRFTANLRDADVIAVYLLPQQLEKLLPQLEKMKPGSRVISHQFEIPGVPPDKVEVVDSTEDGAKHTLYLWTLPFTKPNKFSGGAPLRGDPRLIAVIPVGMKAEELSSEIVSQYIMSIPVF